MDHFFKGLLVLLFVMSVVGILVTSACNSDNNCDDDDDDDLTDNDNCEFAEEVWTDPDTGLIWQNETNCCYSWPDAQTYCEHLMYNCREDWRLPTISELRSLIRGCDDTASGGACDVADSCLTQDCFSDECAGCAFQEGPANGWYRPGDLLGDGWWFWSSDEVSDLDDEAWFVNFDTGQIQYNFTNTGMDVRCVRNESE